MQRLELVIVQLEETKRLIEVGRVPQLRLAHILLDSAIELIMHRMTEQELHYTEGYHFNKLEQLERLERLGRGSDHIRAEIDRIKPLVTPKKRRRDLDRIFGAKVEFLIERRIIPPELGPILGKLHEYRTETYHRDKHRIEIIRPAVLIHFDVACTILDRYDVGIIVRSDPIGPELRRFERCNDDPLMISHTAARQLRAELGLDLPRFQAALIENLASRLEDLEDGLAYVQENLTYRDARPGDALRLLQLDPDDIEAIFDHTAMRSRPCPITAESIRAWIQATSEMEKLADRHALFIEFARIEDEFEALERSVHEAIYQIDEAANMRD
jgi:gluconate kinase